MIYLFCRFLKRTCSFNKNMHVLQETLDEVQIWSTGWSTGKILYSKRLFFCWYVIQIVALFDSGFSCPQTFLVGCLLLFNSFEHFYDKLLVVHRLYTSTKNLSKYWFQYCKIFDIYICFIHCVKSVRIRSYSGPHFPAFGLNMQRFGFMFALDWTSWRFWFTSK